MTMLTRRQLALAPKIKSADERAREAFGKATQSAIEVALRQINFDKCEKPSDAVALLYKRVRRVMRGKGVSFSRLGYIAERMCKMMINAILEAGTEDAKKNPLPGDQRDGEDGDLVLATH